MSPVMGYNWTVKLVRFNKQDASPAYLSAHDDIVIIINIMMFITTLYVNLWPQQKRQQSFHQQQKIMNETGMSFLDSIRNSFENEESTDEQLQA